ncbi:sperm acrosome membrane-associated protein 4-like [Paroedura picta]|uniref:sperm acrosome membrane-associated protein 4-like n=1 Tax=Paroedura picta TaxID=143630 RepID=UPI004057BC2B
MAKRAVATLLLTAAFFQMALCQDVEKKTLHCYNCSYTEPCAEIPTQCQEGEKCGTMLGHSDYKVHDSIFGKGCVPAMKCGTQERISILNSPFRVVYTCCVSDYCNKAVFEAKHKVVTEEGYSSVPTHLPCLFATTLLAVLATLLS